MLPWEARSPSDGQDLSSHRFKGVVFTNALSLSLTSVPPFCMQVFPVCLQGHSDLSLPKAQSSWDWPHCPAALCVELWKRLMGRVSTASFPPDPAALAVCAHVPLHVPLAAVPLVSDSTCMTRTATFKPPSSLDSHLMLRTFFHLQPCTWISPHCLPLYCV